MTTQKHYSTICYDALAAIVASATDFTIQLLPSSELLEEDILLFVHPLSHAKSVTEVLVHLRHEITHFLVMSFPISTKFAPLTVRGHASALAAVWLAHLAHTSGFDKLTTVNPQDPHFKAFVTDVQASGKALKLDSVVAHCTELLLFLADSTNNVTTPVTLHDIRMATNHSFVVGTLLDRDHTVRLNAGCLSALESSAHRLAIAQNVVGNFTLFSIPDVALPGNIDGIHDFAGHLLRVTSTHKFYDYLPFHTMQVTGSNPILEAYSIALNQPVPLLRAAFTTALSAGRFHSTAIIDNALCGVGSSEALSQIVEFMAEHFKITTYLLNPTSSNIFGLAATGSELLIFLYTSDFRHYFIADEYSASRQDRTSIPVPSELADYERPAPDVLANEDSDTVVSMAETESPTKTTSTAHADTLLTRITYQPVVCSSLLISNISISAKPTTQIRDVQSFLDYFNIETIVPVKETISENDNWKIFQSPPFHTCSIVVRLKYPLFFHTAATLNSGHFPTVFDYQCPERPIEPEEGRGEGTRKHVLLGQLITDTESDSIHAFRLVCTYRGLSDNYAVYNHQLEFIRQHLSSSLRDSFLHVSTINVMILGRKGNPPNQLAKLDKNFSNSENIVSVYSVKATQPLPSVVSTVMHFGHLYEVHRSSIGKLSHHLMSTLSSVNILSIEGLSNTTSSDIIQQLLKRTYDLTNIHVLFTISVRKDDAFFGTFFTSSSTATSHHIAVLKRSADTSLLKTTLSLIYSKDVFVKPYTALPGYPRMRKFFNDDKIPALTELPSNPWIAPPPSVFQTPKGAPSKSKSKQSSETLTVTSSITDTSFATQLQSYQEDLTRYRTATQSALERLESKLDHYSSDNHRLQLENDRLLAVTTDLHREVRELISLYRPSDETHRAFLNNLAKNRYGSLHPVPVDGADDEYDAIFDELSDVEIEPSATEPLTALMDLVDPDTIVIPPKEREVFLNEAPGDAHLTKRHIAEGPTNDQK